MAQTPEGKVKLKVDEWLRINMTGCFRFRVPGGPFGQAGMGDYIIVYLGVPIMIEVKADLTKQPNANQLDQLKKFDAAGGISCVLKGFEEPKLRFIKKMCKERANKQFGQIDASI